MVGKADANAADEDGDTPLHVAIMLGHVESARVLFAAPAGIDGYASNNDGDTACDIAMREDLWEIVEWFVW